MHFAAQVPAPVSVSVVQGFLSSQLAGHAPAWGQTRPVSQVSAGGSRMPLPQTGAQSLSALAVQPGGQQPSSALHWVMAGKEHAAWHVPALARTSEVQALLSAHADGQI